MRNYNTRRLGFHFSEGGKKYIKRQYIDMSKRKNINMYENHK